MEIWYLTKQPEILIGKIKISSTNGAGPIGPRYLEDANGSVAITLHKTQVQVDQGPQGETTYKETDSR